MKKLLLLTLAIAPLTSLVYSQNSPTKKNGWEKGKLKGKVKSVTESTYEFGHYSNAEILNEIPLETYKETSQYDEKGNIIKENRYNGDGSLNEKKTYKYDDKGNLIEKNDYGADGILFLKSTSQYDDKGNKIEVNRYFADGILNWKKTYNYDEKGNLIEEKQFQYNEKKFGGGFYNADGILYEMKTFEYGARGNVIETKPDVYKLKLKAELMAAIAAEPDSDLAGLKLSFNKLETCEYDATGNKIEVNGFNADGSLNKMETFEYDDTGNKTEEKLYLFGVMVTSNRTGETTPYRSKKTYKYDDKGNEIEVCSYESGILFMTEIYEYKFDQYGNWIKKSSFENQIPKNIYERKYEYYE